LQSQAQSISNTFQAIAAQLSDHSQLLNSITAFPTPAFGHHNSSALEVLLRTKLEPSTENWIKEGEALAAKQRKAGLGSLSDSDRQALWEWAPGEANSYARRQAWGGDYTRAEVENGIEKVSAGLKRELVVPPDNDDGPDDDDDEEYDTDDDEDDDAMDVEKAAAKPDAKPTGVRPTQVTHTQTPLSQVQKFMSTGT
jgi:mediator of RNA polymerase II transcription subunit 8, fungi type